MNDPVVLHRLYRLSDYPQLESLARERTQATYLDGRACLELYKAALPSIDGQGLEPAEREFMRVLGL
jgi:hypothetical protein